MDDATTKDDWPTALPTAPASVLIAAGGGGEAARLLAAGYEVDAFDPDPGLAAGLSAMAGIGLVAAITPEELCLAIVDGRHGAGAAFSRRRYDAVVLGPRAWGRAAAPGQALRLLKAAARLCPRGPIVALVPPPGDTAAVAGHAAALGREARPLGGGVAFVAIC